MLIGDSVTVSMLLLMTLMLANTRGMWRVA
jgi:hypothetical protein